MRGNVMGIPIPVRQLPTWCLIALGAAVASCAGPPACDARVAVGEIAGLPSRTDVPPVFAARTVSLDGETERVRYCFSIPEGTTLVGLEIETLIVEGRVGWTLIDPSGDVRWSREVEGWHMTSSSDQFEAEAGMWAFEVSADRLDGGYHWSWGPVP
jgi:hypothetical protein